MSTISSIVVKLLGKDLKLRLRFWKPTRLRLLLVKKFYSSPSRLLVTSIKLVSFTDSTLSSGVPTGLFWVENNNSSINKKINNYISNRFYFMLHANFVTLMSICVHEYFPCYYSKFNHLLYHRFCEIYSNLYIYLLFLF